MVRYCVLSALLLATAAAEAAPQKRYSDLYGRQCRLVEQFKDTESSTRRCAAVDGYALLVHEAAGRTSVDIVTPAQQVFRLDYWDVVTPGAAWVGRKAEWWMVPGRKSPLALVMRIDQPPRGASLVVTRVEDDGACVVFTTDARSRGAQAAAAQAAADPARKCLGTYAARSDAE